MSGLPHLHSVRDALRLLEKAEVRLDTVRIPILEALGRVAAEEIRAPSDVPYSNRSVLDGYAARWIDVAYASEESPAVLKLVGHVPVGARPRMVLGPGEAVKVATGSFLPEGADVVIPKEHALEREGEVLVYRPFPAGYGVAVKGEDLKKGDVIIRVGDVIDESVVGVLASIGVDGVRVWERPRAALLVVGDEVRPPGSALKPGEVYDSTGFLVEAWLSRRGVRVASKRYLPDSLERIRSAISDIIEFVDFIFTTGGTSVGERDVTVRAVEPLADDVVHGLRLTPGRPGGVALVSGKPVIMLSGMPVAAFSELVAVFDPYYRRLLGREDPWETVVTARLSRRYVSHPGMVNVVRSVVCQRGADLLVSPLRVTGSGILSTLLKANSYFIVDEDITGLDEGEPVEVRLAGPVRACQGD